MKLTFKSIHIESFLSLGVVDISLQDGGYTLVRGHNNNPMDSASSNGSGKSSIFEAIVWCLTGTTMRGSKDVSNIRTNTGALVELEVDVDDVTYKICRSKDHIKYKTNLRLFCNGEDISGKGIRDSEKALAERLPDLNAELLGSVIVLGQGLPCRFTRNTPAGRKDVLEKLSKSDFMIEDLKVRVSARKARLNEDLRLVQDQQLTRRTQLDAAVKDQEEAKTALERFKATDMSEQRLLDLQKQQEDVCSQEAEFKLMQEKQSSYSMELFTELNKLRSDKQAEESKVHSEVKDSLTEMRVTRAELAANKKSTERRIQEIDAIRDVCPTCGQKLQGVTKPDTAGLVEELDKLIQDIKHIDSKIAEQEAYLAEQLAELTERYREQETTLNKLYCDSAALANEYSIKCDLASQRKYSIMQDIHSLELQRTASATQMVELETRIHNSEAIISSAVSELDTLANEITVLTERIAVITKFETILKRDFRGALLNNVISYIQDVSLDYAADIFENNSLEFKLDGNNIVIRYDDRDYENLSGGERQKVDIVIQFAIRDMLCRFLNFDSSILVLDEIFDNLDATGSKRVNDMLAKRLSGIDSIYIISHHADELNIPVDKVLTVVKDDSGVSSVQ